ncbi:hypothetical protein C2G38_2059284 [Gigaspora rosea]|uniref:Isoprenoid synthase domain-containing protein n=1 Tax=Gigaspora rosea TaxID=44941 RepID=A0A397WA44_9GLOM|nr:hypothetical protein C2G38_2059284 [Gigaspora rosea]
MDLKTYTFDETKKESKTILQLLNYFNLDRTVNVKLNYCEEIDNIAQCIIDKYDLKIKLYDIRTIASVLHDSQNFTGIQAYYYFLFIADDLLVFKNIDYIDVINALEGRENNLPQLVCQLITICMKHWKNEFGLQYNFIRTEIITWVTSVNQQIQAQFSENEYFIFKLKCHFSYLTLVLMFRTRNVSCTYLEYHLLKTIYEKFIFYINELGSCLREQGDGEITSVDMLFKTNDFSRISEYCTQQIYNTMGEIEGKCNLMVKLEFLHLCKNTVFVHLAFDRYLKCYLEN